MFPLSATLLDKLNLADALIVEADITETHFLAIPPNLSLSNNDSLLMNITFSTILLRANPRTL